ncbi:MAG: hypothetical protein M1821_004016 [Bathelium mastoideum]|nr:MAG: hypothetical protein M1821_004016 [Bathelium mastoideum]KAI9691088.1 MAG: hypothetical protein M1822_008708 [Bathelium mastoideum]
MTEDAEKQQDSSERSVQDSPSDLTADLESGKDTAETVPNAVEDRSDDVVDDERDQTQTTSTPPNANRDKRFEVKFEGDDDPLNPKSKSKIQKWIITLIVSSCSFCVTCASTLYTSTYDQLEYRFGTTREIATLGLTTFVLGLAVGPMLLSPLSEFYGRRPVYIGSFLLFLIWLVPCAVAPNMQTEIIGRFFDGLVGRRVIAFLSVAGGTVGDLFAKHELSAPMMIYTASPFTGPELGPLIGGFVNQFADWRWTFYVLLIAAGVELALIVFFVPETYYPVLLRQKAQKLRKETGNDAWYAPIEVMDRSIAKTVLWSCIRPFQLLALEPMCLNLCLLSAILLGILYLFFGAFALVFQHNHGFNLWQTGLTFMGIFVGMVIGICCDPLWRRNYARLVRQREKAGGEPGGSEPEFRLPPTIAGAILVSMGLFGFGWTTYPWVG